MTSTMRQSRLGFDVHGITMGQWQANGRAHSRLLRRHAGLRHRHRDGRAASALRLRTPRARRHRRAGRTGPRDARPARSDVARRVRLPAVLPRRQPLPAGAAGARSSSGSAASPSRAASWRRWPGDAGTSYVFAPAPGGGERSERPAFQAHLGYGRGTPEGAGEAQVGVSGHYGWIRQAGRLIPAVGRRARPQPAARPRRPGRRGLSRRRTRRLRLGRRPAGTLRGRLDRRPAGRRLAPVVQRRRGARSPSRRHRRGRTAAQHERLRQRDRAPDAGSVGVDRVQVAADALRPGQQPREPPRERRLRGRRSRERPAAACKP